MSNQSSIEQWIADNNPYEKGSNPYYNWMEGARAALRSQEGKQGEGEDFLDVLKENYEAMKRIDRDSRDYPFKPAILETYEDLISIYKKGNWRQPAPTSQTAEPKEEDFRFYKNAAEVLLERKGQLECDIAALQQRIAELEGELKLERQSRNEYPDEFNYAERHSCSIYSHHAKFVNWARTKISELEKLYDEEIHTMNREWQQDRQRLEAEVRGKDEIIERRMQNILGWKKKVEQLESTLKQLREGTAEEAEELYPYGTITNVEVKEDFDLRKLIQEMSNNCVDKERKAYIKGRTAREKWVSVSDKGMPEDLDEDYFVYVDFGEDGGARVTAKTDGIDWYFIPQEGNAVKIIVGKVTHWQPLPPAPDQPSSTDKNERE